MQRQAVCNLDSPAPCEAGANELLIDESRDGHLGLRRELSACAIAADNDIERVAISEPISLAWERGRLARLNGCGLRDGGRDARAPRNNEADKLLPACAFTFDHGNRSRLALG